MSKRKERSLVELYKRTDKMSRPRVTPILEGNCRMQGPLDEFGSEFETDMACSMEGRAVEESLVATMDCSISTNAALQCNNEIQNCTVDLPNSTCDEQLTGMRVTRSESSNDHCIGKMTTRNIVEGEETSVSVKTRANRNTRRARGSKIRKTDRARNHADDRQDVEERKSASVIEGDEKLLEGPGISQSNFNEGIPSAGKKLEESHEKCSTDKVFDVLKSVGNPHDGDIDVCCHEENMKEQVGAERELPSIEPNDVNNMDSGDSDRVETSSNKKNPDTCNISLISVENEITKEKTGSKDLPGLRASVSFQSLHGFDSDLHLPASENAGVLGIHLNGDLCNTEDIKENPTKLENTDNLAATHTESHAETNITLAEGTSGLPSKVDTENVTTSGKGHSGKVLFGKIEDSVDVIGKLQLACNEGKFLLQNNNIEARTSTNANETTADGYCNHSSPGYGLCLAGVEQADMAVEYSPLDHSSTSSLHKGEPQNRHTGEENILQEAFSSFPLSITPGHSSVTSHASQCIATTKEIEAHSSCQQEDLIFRCSPEPTEISSTKNPISTVEEAKDVAPVLPEVLPKVPDYHRDECVKSNFSAGFVAISGVPGLYSESGNDINHVPVEVGPDLHLEPGEQVKTVSKEDTFHDAEIKFEEDFHIDKGNINVVPSEMASCSEDSLLCQSLLEKSIEPLSAEDDVKVCDICGDTGYEEMLAVCSMCNDGAEHTYCMPSMLDEVPESDWLCEGCKLQQNASVKTVETPPNLRMVLKPAFLTSRKHNYGTSRSRLSAKLGKTKLGPDRQRAIKGTLSSQVSTKRQAEGFEVGPPMKKLALQASNGHSDSLISNAKPIFSRENSFKALGITKVKTPITVSPTVNSFSSSLHDSDNSSALLRASSPRPSTNMQSSKNKFVSPNGLATDPSAFTGTSKAGSNVASTGLATLTGKSSTDRTLPSLPPARLSNIEKLSPSPKIINDSTKAGYQAKAARENMSNISAVGGFSKSSKYTANSNLSALSESMLTSDIQNVKIKEMRTGKVRNDISDLSRSKSMAMPLCIPRDPVSAGITNFENLGTDGICIKPVTCAIKDSSKSILSEEKKAFAPTQVLPHSNKKEHSSIRSSGEGQTQLKASPSRLQEGTATNKLQQSASIEVVHNIEAKNLKGLSHIDTTSVVKPMAEGNIFSPSIEDSKNNSCTKVVAEGYPSEHGKKGGSLHRKIVPNNNLVQETKKSGNSENFSSLKLSSRIHPSVVGTTRCYKCKQLGHSAQSCTNNSLAEPGSNRFRVSTLISPTRSSKEISDNGNRKLSASEETALPGKITGCQNSQSSGKKQLNFDSDVRDHAQWSGSRSPRQVSSNQEMSYADLKSNSTIPSKGTTDLNGKLDVKNSENEEFSASNVNLAGCSITAPQILASRPWKSPMSNHSSATSKINGESISRAGFNERKRTEWVANSQKHLYHRRLEEGEGRFLARDSSHIATTATQPAVHSAEGTAVAIGGNTSSGLPTASDASDQPHTESRVVQRQHSSHPEIVKATILPEHNFLWQGGFEVRNKANSFNYFDGIQAHASTCAASKVLDAVKKFSSKLQLEEVPRCSSWPLQFQYSHPSDENIALYFFAKDHESYGKSYRLLLEHVLKNDFALRGNIDGVELLVFPSNQLPQKSQRWNRLLFLWGVFRGRNSSCFEPSTCAAAFSAAEGMDAEKDGGGESCAPTRDLRTFRNQLSPSVSDQGEILNGSCFNIPNSSSVKDMKVDNAQKNDDNAAAHLLLVEKNSTRLGDLDFPPGFESITAKKPHKSNDDIICQSQSIQEDGSGKTVESGTNEEVSSSHKTSKTEKINFNSGYTPGPSDISLNSTEKLTCSCVTSRIAFCDSPGQQSEIDKGKSRVQDSENVREMDMDQESRLHEKDSEKNWATVVEGERERSLSSSKQEDYSNHESKNYRDGRLERCHPHLSHNRSPPTDGIQSHSPKMQVHNYDQQHIQTECPGLDRISHMQSSSGKQVHGKIHEFVGSPIEKSSNDIVVGRKQGQRKLKKSEGEIQSRQSREEQDQSGRVSAETKMSGVPTYQIADLNRVPDYDSALEFSGTPVQHHIQPEYPDYIPSVPQDSKVIETMLFPGPEDIRVNCRLSKLSEEWTTGLGSKQNSSGPSSSGQFVATAEENIQERPDLNIPILELSLGRKKSSPNPVILPLSTKLLPNSPIKSSLIEGIERGSSLSLSLAFPFSQKDQTAKTLKEDQPNPANCSVNTSICLFGRRVDC